MSQPYGAPGRLSTSANLKPAPTDHTAAIAEKAREWVAAHDALVAAASFGEDDSHHFVAEREAVGTLLAAVDAERAERECKS